MSGKKHALPYQTRLNGVSLEAGERQALLALAESVDDMVAAGAAARLDLDGVPWSLDTLLAEYDASDRAGKVRQER